MEENTMTMDVALPWNQKFAIQNKPKPEFGEGISSLLGYFWVDTSPFPFDTMSIPAVGALEEENRVTVFFNEALGIGSAKWFRQTVSELAKLSMLPRDWNSDNPARVNPKAIENILTLLLEILDSDSAPPVVVPTTRGGVQIEWHQNGIDLEIEAFNSSELEYYFSGPEGELEGTIKGDSTTLKQFKDYLKAT